MASNFWSILYSHAARFFLRFANASSRSHQWAARLVLADAATPLLFLHCTRENPVSKRESVSSRTTCTRVSKQTPRVNIGGTILHFILPCALLVHVRPTESSTSKPTHCSSCCASTNPTSRRKRSLECFKMIYNLINESYNSYRDFCFIIRREWHFQFDSSFPYFPLCVRTFIFVNKQLYLWR